MAKVGNYKELSSFQQFFFWIVLILGILSVILGFSAWFIKRGLLYHTIQGNCMDPWSPAAVLGNVALVIFTVTLVLCGVVFCTTAWPDQTMPPTHLTGCQSVMVIVRLIWWSTTVLAWVFVAVGESSYKFVHRCEGHDAWAYLAATMNMVSTLTLTLVVYLNLFSPSRSFVQTAQVAPTPVEPSMPV